MVVHGAGVVTTQINDGQTNKLKSESTMNKSTQCDLTSFVPIYYATQEQAQSVVDTLPPFKASRFCVGIARYKIVGFTKGYAIQLGDYGNYHPRTNADLEDEETKVLKQALQKSGQL